MITEVTNESRVVMEMKRSRSTLVVFHTYEACKAFASMYKYAVVGLWNELRCLMPCDRKAIFVYAQDPCMVERIRHFTFDNIVLHKLKMEELHHRDRDALLEHERRTATSVRSVKRS